jgi:hypothetical protein
MRQIMNIDQKGDRRIQVANFHQVWQHILQDSRRGMMIQRYKGQLFEFLSKRAYSAEFNKAASSKYACGRL